MVSKSPSIARNQSKPDAYRHNLAEKSAHSRLAGLVGLFTGTGALLAVGLYLPLPSRLQQAGLASERALADTYYIAGATAVVVAIACYLGLNASNRDPAGESQGLQNANPIGKRASKFSSYLPQALRLGLTKPSLGLAFLASFVARSSSVGISLFIPLFVNASLCDHPAKDIEEVETHCRRAYVTAAQLTGVSQLFALLFAPIFGFAPSQYRNVHVPLMLATVSGAVGYTAFAKMNTSETSPALFVVVALLGISQIGAIVSSLSLVSSFVNQERSPQGKFVDDPSCPVEGHAETSPLIDTPSTSETFEYLKGTIAGVYSLFGSLAILILTKFGGLLFDRLGPESPFYLLAIFNLSLLFALLGCDFVESYKRPD
ncbi:MAG: hypothetical protein LQ338_002431 [Usnochroma carphineum]|nr:MAG: hypothetical protein LQ338_002431 [Usnochroma carphineum]